MKYTWILLFPFVAQAQNLSCFVTYKGVSKPMYWYAGGRSHHAPGEFEYLNVQIQEKSTPDKVEIQIAEATDDEAWKKLSELSEGLEPELKNKVRSLGRTRITKAYVGLYAGVLHYEMRLGTDPNLLEISCADTHLKTTETGQ